MNIQAEFTHSVVTELNYKLITSASSIEEDTREILDQSTQGQIAIHRDLKNCFIELITDVKTTINESPYRSLELSVEFFFDLHGEDLNMKRTKEDKDKIFEEIRTKVENSLIDFCRQQLREITRQITSIDYHFPLITENIVVKFND